MDNLSAYSDEALVGLSLQHKRFYGEIVRRYEKKLGAYIHRLSRLNPEDIEDVLQEVFIKVYINLNSFDPDLKFSSWIYRIAHNETMAFFRKRNVRPQGHLVAESETVLEALASEFNLLKDIEAAEHAELVVAALDALPEPYREVLILQFFEHKGYEEISDILALPPGTVATRISRGKERLRAILKTNGYIHD